MAKVQKFKVNLKDASLRVLLFQFSSRRLELGDITRLLSQNTIPRSKEIIMASQLSQRKFEHSAKLLLVCRGNRKSPFAPVVACSCGVNTCSSVSCSRNIIVRGKLLSFQKQASCAENVSYLVTSDQAKIYGPILFFQC